MKRLYIVRHAKSSWKFPELSDIDRPLNKRGQRDVPMMSDRLKTRNISIDVVISSPSVRTKTTALYLASEIAQDPNVVLINELYHATAITLLQVIRELDNANTNVMLVGHNPGLTTFANKLGMLSIDNIPTCGIVALNFRAKTWSEIDYGNAELDFFDYPKNIT